MPGKSRSSKKTPPPPSRNTRKRCRNGSESAPEESLTSDSSESKTDKKTTKEEELEEQELVDQDNPDNQPQQKGDKHEGPVVNVKKEVKNNVLKCLDQLQYGCKRDRYFYLKTVGNHFVKKSIEDLVHEGTSFTDRFTSRITAIEWHEKSPYDLASASKFGDISWTCGVPDDTAPSKQINARKFNVKAKVGGGGLGYAVTAMKFHGQERHLLFRSSVDGTIARVDFINGKVSEYYNTGDFQRWFSSMDINIPRQMLVAGDNKGMGYQFTIDGKLLTTWKLHRNKIHHCEFSKKDPNLLVTCALGKSDAVRIWDIRNMRQPASKTRALLEPLKSLAHNAGLICAKFSPVDGSRLLTTDTYSDVRVYQGPLWEDFLTIKHHHRQFGQITPMKAEWHPVNDYIVIGKYPWNLDSDGKRFNKSLEARAIEFFDSYSGELVSMIYPPRDIICSLNVFNATGEYLATGMSSKLILWRPGGKSVTDVQTVPTSGPVKIAVSAAARNILRGRGRWAREYSPVSDDEGSDEDVTSKKKRARTANNSTATANSHPSKKKKK